MKNSFKIIVLFIGVALGFIPFGACTPTHSPPLQVSQAEEFTGKVVGVKDGDTIVVMYEGKGETIRLYGIDAPENNQDYGAKAKQFVSDLIFDQVVRVKGHEKDRYGRTIGEIFMEDGRSVNQEIVRVGLAWWYEKYASKDVELKKLQNDAQMKKIGLWNMKNPIAPWEFRKLKK